MNNEEDIIYKKFLKKEELINDIIIQVLKIIKSKDKEALKSLKEKFQIYEYELLKFSILKRNKEFENSNKLKEIQDNKHLLNKYTNEIKSLEEQNNFEYEKNDIKFKLQSWIDNMDQLKDPEDLKSKISFMDTEIKNIKEELKNNENLLEKRNFKIKYALSIFSDLMEDIEGA